MTRWTLRVLAPVFLLLIVNPTASRGQQDYSKVEIKVTHVSGHVYMLEGAGGNIGVSAGPDGILIVDDQFAPLAEKIRAALSGINPGKLRFVLNTHWHSDHTGGNAVFGQEGTIIAHENVRKRLMTEQKIFNRVVPASPPEAWPVITFDESLTVHFNGDDIMVMYLPKGHTDGDSAVYFTKANVLHLGDDFFSGRFPFVDLGSGGDVQGLIRSVESIAKRIPPDVKIIPGHGPLSTLGDLKAYHRMLVDTATIVRGKMEAGKTLEEITKDGLPSEWETWGSGFINTGRWIEIVYRSLSSSGDRGPTSHH